MGEKFLDRVYDASTPEGTQALYDAWASTYDAEIAENGYATPGRVAEAMFKHVPDSDAPILDFGCGTGLSGLALKLAGFSTIDGMDPSPEMVDGARKKGVYRSLTVLDVKETAPVPKDAYRAITAIGVIGTGAAPASTFGMLMKALPKGGLLGLSLNDHALADPRFEAALNEWLDCGAAHLRFKKYGPHLPGLNLKCNVYVIEKA